MKKKEAIIRKCVATGGRAPKAELLRVVRSGDVVRIDLEGKAEGRGAYVTPSSEIIKKAWKKNAFARALKMKIDDAIYLELLAITDEGEVATSD